MCSKEFKIELSKLVSHYDLFKCCDRRISTTSKCNAFLLVYQLLFLRDATSLSQKYEPLLETTELPVDDLDLDGTNERQVQLKHGAAVVSQEL